DFTSSTFPVSFFFQAEDGIRDFHVTGVQTCALPMATLPSPADALPWAWLRPAAADKTNREINVNTVFVASLFMNNPTFLKCTGFYQNQYSAGPDSAANSPGSLANPSGGHFDEASGREL